MFTQIHIIVMFWWKNKMILQLKRQYPEHGSLDTRKQAVIELLNNSRRWKPFYVNENVQEQNITAYLYLYCNQVFI